MTDGRHEASERIPIRETSGSEPARCDHHVATVGGLNEAWNVGRRMGEVAVHGHQTGVSVMIRPQDAFEVSAANSLFLGSMDDLKAVLRQAGRG